MRTLIISLLFLVQGAFGEVVIQPVYTTASSYPSYGYFLGLTEGNDGNFYGMRYEYQNFQTNEILFRLSPAGTFAKIATLNGSGTRTSAYGALLLAKDGNFYGTTPRGGSLQQGVLFRYNGSAVSYLYSFDGFTAGVPDFSLVEANDGFLYGVTTSPAAIYRVTTNGTVTVLTNFPAGNRPIDGLAEGPDGWLYGATYYSVFLQPPSASIYKFSPSEGFKTLKIFSGDTRPNASPVSGNDGFLYGPAGTDSSFPTTNSSWIYKMSTNGTMTNVVTFPYPYPAAPSSRLVLASDGNLFGITTGGVLLGNSVHGTIFTLSTNGALTTVVELDGTSVTEKDSLVDATVPFMEARNSILYGTSSWRLQPTGVAVQRVYRLVERPVVQCDAHAGQPAVITWNSFSGGVYRVDYQASLDSTDWVTLNPSLTATGLVSSYLDDSVGIGQRFYRVALLP